ncbi:MAG: UDP-N-acetylmuramoyl-L-alanyl-D-glutamate--2,6-diaminopimelate ligase [Treponema sp.]|nr:UDP-N-acetylmuramoyl-L-alanyl-D-glutamate--2,6-diaminopimelate ligase [Treponema sp.]
MEKILSALLPVIKYKALAADGITPLDENIIGLTPVTDIVFDSRLVTAGALFFALPGLHTDGNRFIKMAVEKGANVIIYQGEIPHEEQLEIAKIIIKRGIDKALESKMADMPVFLKVDDARLCMGPVSDAFYDSPSKKLKVIGVTGTEGKSSTVSFVWQLLRLAGHKAGFISTVQYSLGSDAMSNPQHTTTPESPIVQKHLYDMILNGCEYAVVESSSHGLSKKLGRLDCVCFDCGIFMNVTLEHLEFHGTFDQYKHDKANLFRALDEHNHIKTINGERQEVPSFGIVNLEDKEFPYFAENTKQKIYGFTTNAMAGKAAGTTEGVPVLPEIPQNISVTKGLNITSTQSGISFECEHMGERFTVNANLPGAFNTYNVMAALIAVSGLTGLKFTDLVPLIPSLKPVCGRMTTLNFGQEFEVLVDYAHTPSSFETIFPPVKNRCKGKVIALFGSAGERDTTKRPLQGEIAGRLCDVVILTDEDPRQEDSMKIIQDIGQGALKAGKTLNSDLFYIADRKQAIRRAFAMASKDDIVLLLGKGHENSIIYKDYTMPYDEIAEATSALNEMGYTK